MLIKHSMDTRERSFQAQVMSHISEVTRKLNDGCRLGDRYDLCFISWAENSEKKRTAVRELEGGGKSLKNENQLRMKTIQLK